MNKHQEMINMVEAMVEECVEEAVEIKVNDSAMTIVHEAVHQMSKSDPGFSSIKEIVRRQVSDIIKNNIELLTKRTMLEAELKLAKRVAVVRAAIIEKLDLHSTTRNKNFDILDGCITSTAMDAGEDTLGGGGDITSILNMAHAINEEDVEFFKQTLAVLKNKLPGEDYVRELNSELKAIAEQEKAINRLFEDSEDEEMIKVEKVKAIK